MLNRFIARFIKWSKRSGVYVQTCQWRESPHMEGPIRFCEDFKNGSLMTEEVEDELDPMTGVREYPNRLGRMKREGLWVTLKDTYSVIVGNHYGFKSKKDDDRTYKGLLDIFLLAGLGRKSIAKAFELINSFKISTRLQIAMFFMFAFGVLVEVIRALAGLCLTALASLVVVPVYSIVVCFEPSKKTLNRALKIVQVEEGGVVKARKLKNFSIEAALGDVHSEVEGKGLIVAPANGLITVLLFNSFNEETVSLLFQLNYIFSATGFSDIQLESGSTPSVKKRNNELKHQHRMAMTEHVGQWLTYRNKAREMLNNRLPSELAKLTMFYAELGNRRQTADVRNVILKAQSEVAANNVNTQQASFKMKQA